MPFGLHNATQTFQRLINEVLRGLPFAFAYIDDVLIASRVIKEHQKPHVTSFRETSTFWFKDQRKQM